MNHCGGPGQINHCGGGGGGGGPVGHCVAPDEAMVRAIHKQQDEGILR